MKKLLFFSSLIALVLLVTSAQKKPLRIFLIGDSTMADKPSVADNPERGWGMVLPSFFNDKVIIENHARNGRSSRTFIQENRWNYVMGRIQPGDYVVIQFCHNDEVKEKKSFTTPEDFRANFKRFVSDVRSKGANPILCTPVARRKFDSIGNPIETHPVYPAIIREVAKEMNVPLIDMQTKSAAVLRKYGKESSARLYMNIEPGKWKLVPDGRKDDTHFVEAGAMEMAACFVDGIRDLKIEPLTQQLKQEKPAQVKYTIPVPGIDSIKPKKKG